MEIKSLEKYENGQARFPGCSHIRDYEFLDKLGEGTFGEVYKARSKKDTKIVALKKILMHHEKEGFPITAIREIKLMKALCHPNILQLKEMSIERGKGEGRKKPSMYMVFPYMEHDLSGLLENPAVQFTEPQIKCYLMQLLEGLKFMHANRILHRDMKAANLLISNGGILQIADFGLARPYDDAPPLPGKGGGDSKREYTALVVTRWYRPPELLLQLRKYTTAIDLWGVGCVFGEMFKGKPILAGNSDLNQAELIFNLVGTPTEENMPGWSQLPGCEGVKNFAYKRGNLHGVFKDLNPAAISLLSEFLKLDWRKRINAMDALKHPYFTTPPLPARPGEIPQFADSHELDRKKFRSQRVPMPPVPPPVSDSSNGAWPSSGSRGADSRHGRIPGPPRGGRPNMPGNHGHHPPHGNPQRRGPFPPTQRDIGLPPRPPVPTRPPWEVPQSNRPDGRDDRRNQSGQGRPGPRPGNLDSYVPNYSNSDRDRGSDRGERGDRGNDRSRDSGEHGSHSNADWRSTGRRDYRRDPPSRRRSRSPGFRDGSRG
ncbi:hypothetical protein DTO013E5_3984 [Penicillium roqueforti]|uniref:Serine/threonine-protein kinase BUR1 n=1 Tax=Penicillium roqueforti (strain FM164) TaxID=1365484 RepID=W6PVZ9_PENRF|nr:uncharacterized protein LCP9604111_1585 [Penicillium roqueforti]CDM28090.1 Serine/threonine-protein kinase bur1 [Penicillium roqueforti FM164]KAF9251589.1 hypothetical protein LCP9604111_1585 [Penicillium roqueforti]KAI1836598.1 hypothetical protein CBS147337_2825 [Penicillium roqueforti]KAI2685264.1 hypothetical protein LCP963914a_4591 [Penicillium roqueforti]KAI2690390.1 hypothetical protein CBS147355_841 [Penicillium roqueforti]